MSAGFEVRALESRYAFMDECPQTLIADVVTFPLGTLQERVAGVLAWRDALLTGNQPPAGTWPGPRRDAAARAALEQMGIPRFCRNQPQLVEALLTDLMQAFRGATTRFDEAVETRLAELEALERQRHTEPLEGGTEPPAPLEPVEAAEVAYDRLRALAVEEVEGEGEGPDVELLETWSHRAQAWHQVAEVFGDLGHLLGRGWDLSQGILRHTGWTEIAGLRALVEQVPELKELVRALGRLQVSDAEELSVCEQIFEPVRRLEEEVREVRTPNIPAEMRGVERSAELSRMLPSEAVMLGHPQMRMLWHARRAERALLTYRVEGIELERTLTESWEEEAQQEERPRLERGPIIAAIDTSGSMQGLPEQAAKAIVLEAARIAHEERRECYLYAFSGPGQILEHELDLSEDGLGKLLSFLAMSFAGGTDPGEAVQRVTLRLDEAGWSKADVIVVSDGEFAVRAQTLELVEMAREQGTRFHGIQIARGGRSGLHSCCDPVHIFSDWTDLLSLH